MCPTLFYSDLPVLITENEAIVVQILVHQLINSHFLTHLMESDAYVLCLQLLKGLLVSLFKKKKKIMLSFMSVHLHKHPKLINRIFK